MHRPRVPPENRPSVIKAALIPAPLIAEVNIPENGILSRTLHNDDRIKHVLLPFVGEYLAQGLGVPDQPAVEAFLIEFAGLPPEYAAVQAANLVEHGFLSYDDLSVIEPDSLMRIGKLNAEQADAVIEQAEEKAESDQE